MAESPIIPTPGDDPEMEAAALRARQTFRYFWRELAWEHRRIVPGLDLAAVKACFSDPPEMRSQDPNDFEVEQMWLMDVDFDGRQLTGTLINSPHSLQTYSEGDQVTIAGKQIFDWMYVVDGNVYGGFTVDVLRSRMDKKERKEHDQAWGFEFGEVGIVDLVPPEYIGLPPRKKGFFSGFGGSKATPQDPAVVAAAEHPMSVNMSQSLDQKLTHDPDFLLDVNDHGYNILHQHALAGSYDGVDVCLQHGADPNQAAPNGMTPFKLAKVFNWKRVMARLQKAGGT